MKELSKGLPYIIGAFIIFPLLLWVVNSLFFKGNDTSDQIISIYLNNSKVDTFELKGGTEEQSSQYSPKLSKYGGSLFLYKNIFFCDKYNKYLAIITISDIEPFGQNYHRMGLFQQGLHFTGAINTSQIQNDKYGTKENPLPIFPLNLLSGIELNNNDYKTFQVTDTINRKFVEQYLKYFMPKKEFKEMFRGK